MSNRAKEIAAIMATYEPGQVWQWKCKGDSNWIDYAAAFQPGWDWRLFDYRRKPEPPSPKYRPWTPEEGVGKVIKTSIGLALITSYEGGLFRTQNLAFSAGTLLEAYIQPDGSPCGVLETPTTN